MYKSKFELSEGNTKDSPLWYNKNLDLLEMNRNWKKKTGEDLNLKSMIEIVNSKGLPHKTNSNPIYYKLMEFYGVINSDICKSMRKLNIGDLHLRNFIEFLVLQGKPTETKVFISQLSYVERCELSKIVRKLHEQLTK